MPDAQNKAEEITLVHSIAGQEWHSPSHQHLPPSPSIATFTARDPTASPCEIDHTPFRSQTLTSPHLVITFTFQPRRGSTWNNPQVLPERGVGTISITKLESLIILPNTNWVYLLLSCLYSYQFRRDNWRNRSELNHNRCKTHMNLIVQKYISAKSSTLWGVLENWIVFKKIPSILYYRHWKKKNFKR